MEITFRLIDKGLGKKINQVINSINTNKQAFDKFFYTIYGNSSSKPTQKFVKNVLKLQEEIGKEKFLEIAYQMLTITIDEEINEDFLIKSNQQFIKGVVWSMSHYNDLKTIKKLSDLTLKSFTKMRHVGSVAIPIGNACVYALSTMKGKDGFGALSRLKQKIKINTVKKTIDKNLLEGAKKYNISVEELKEITVPDFGLVNGQKTIAFDDYSLQIAIDNSKLTQQWLKPDGAVMKSVPNVVKNSDKLTAKLKELRKEVKEIQKVYTAQKQRIDNQFILDRSIDYASFQKYYLHHSLVNPIVKKLIWTLSNKDISVNAVFIDDNWCTLNNEPIDWADESSSIKLWHPIHTTEEEIVLWRDKMIALEWKQPLKQAFREIYVLTDAETNTQSYSNRMAGHILSQYQFKALSTLREWSYNLLKTNDFNDIHICEKVILEHDIKIEYNIARLKNVNEFNENHIWLYVTTGQIIFKNISGETLDLIDVPKIVFTEIMRDIDLFVGVSSVGNDPEWVFIHGEEQFNIDYWQSYAFGDLSEIAKTRKSILERLLPRLTKLKGKAHLEGKFLTVQGTLRTYKIHIGSGNILMAPNDQYLCIVPSRSVDKTTEKLFIPFEGDKGLSIVLSKAFLLADDNKITDETILSQINR